MTDGSVTNVHPQMNDEPELEQATLIGLSHDLAKHIVNWLRSVEAQETRVKSGIDEMAPSRWPDAQLFAVALRNLIRACWKCHDLYDQPRNSPFGNAVQSFERAIPNARDIRNRLEHFDDYETQDIVSVFITNDGLELTLHVDDFRLDLHSAVVEAQRLARSCLTALKVISG